MTQLTQHTTPHQTPPRTLSSRWRIIGFFACAFLGGMVAQALLAISPVLASNLRPWDRIFTVNDAETNQFGVQTFVQRGGTALKFHDPSGVGRLQMGTYGVTKEGSDVDLGIPMMAMSDSEGRVRVLLRLKGSHQVPTLIFRDSEMKDRLVLGLEDSLGEDAYLTTYDSSGQQTTRFNKLQ